MIEVDVNALRMSGEFESQRSLLRNGEITGALSRVKSRNKKRDQALRYQMLMNGLLLTHDRAPEIFDIVSATTDIFNVNAEVEIFVSQHWESIASVIKINDGKYAIIVSPNLLNILNLDELKYVIGHEIAHIAFGHFEISRLDCDKLPSRLSSELFAVNRMGEISADLAGASLTTNPTSARSALSKLASGGSNTFVALSAEADLAQIKDISAMLEDDVTLFEVRSSHPASVLRMHILSLLEAHRLAAPLDSFSYIRELHNSITDVLDNSFPKPNEKENWLTILAAFWVSYADDNFHYKERREVSKLCSAKEFNELNELVSEQDSPSIFLSQYFSEALKSEDINKSKKAMLLEKVVLIARADGSINIEEEEIIEEICKLLELDTAFMAHILAKT